MPALAQACADCVNLPARTSTSFGFVDRRRGWPGQARPRRREIVQDAAAASPMARGAGCHSLPVAAGVGENSGFFAPRDAPAGGRIVARSVWVRAFASGPRAGTIA